MTKQPDATFRDGSLKATIWRNEGENGQYFSTKLSRSYQDQEGNWQETSNLRDGDLLRGGSLLGRSHEYVREQKQAQSQSQSRSEEREDSRKADFQAKRSERTISQDRGIER